ncbi:MAG: hypothetical protein IJA12_04965 [Oscillospiraceae bacterium]|nr:hypothetical protein [Oscillospiraceae bacterium]
MSYKLLKWNITKSVWENNSYHATGNVYDNPKFKEGMNITTSEIKDCEFDQYENLIIQTKNSCYLLPKKSFNGKEYSMVEEMTEAILSLKEKLMSTAKKLLSVGDVLICYDRIIYYSEEGLIFLKVTYEENWTGFYIASYEKENLQIRWNSDNNYDCANIYSMIRENNDGFVYSISFNNKQIKKKSFRTIVQNDFDDDSDELFFDF